MSDSNPATGGGLFSTGLSRLRMSLVLIFAGLFLWGCGEDTESVDIAEAGTVWWNAPMFVAHEFYGSEDIALNVNAFNVPTGLDSKNAVVNGNADFGVVASTPLVNAALKEEKIYVLGSYMRSDKLVGLIKPQGKNWEEVAGGDIYYTKGTISEFYMHKYLESTQNSTVGNGLNLINVGPPGITAALANREGDEKIAAAFGFEPFLAFANAELESPHEIDRDAGYVLQSYIITSVATYEERPDAVERFVKAFALASEAITEGKPDGSSEEWPAAIAAKLGIDEAAFKDLWDDVDFTFTRDADQIEAVLMEEFRLAQRAGVVPPDAPAPEGLFDDMLVPLR